MFTTSFNDKPLIDAANKMDVVKRGELAPEKEEMLRNIETEMSGEILAMSTVTEEGVMDVKSKACELLLQHRVDMKYKSKKVDGILNRLNVAIPEKRDNKARPAFIPEAALRKQKEKMERELDDGEEEMETSVPKKKTERQIEL